jgi:hypothetical protein
MIDVLVVGGGFGRDFLHLYRSHADVGQVGLVEPEAGLRRELAEGFNVYGDVGALEWPSAEGQAAVVYRAGPQDGSRRGRPIHRDEVDAPDRVETLPTALRRFVRPTMYAPLGGRPAFDVPAWHGAARAASITAPGIVAHRSALAGGRMLGIPVYAR